MKIVQILASLLAVAILAGCGGQSAKKAVKDVELKSEKDSVSYSIGLSIAESLKKDNMDDINPQAFMKAFYDMKENKDYDIKPEETQQIIQTYANKKKDEQKQANLEKSKKFLEENKKKEGFEVTESGLQYKVIDEGSGKSPGENDRVKVHYEGTLSDGEVFDSSYERDEPAKFRVNRVIPGWTEALKKMKVGGKWKVVIPPELGYGERGARGAIGPNEALVFEVELLEILPPKEEKQQQPQMRQ